MNFIVYFYFYNYIYLFLLFFNNLKSPQFARLMNATLCIACLCGNATHMLRANAEAYGLLRFSIRHFVRVFLWSIAQCPLQWRAY